MNDLKAIDIKNCEVGPVTSMKDASVKFVIYSPELRPSEAGALMQFHGKACQVALIPHDVEEFECIEVTTEREVKSTSQRLYNVLYMIHKTNPEYQNVPFEVWRLQKMEALIEKLKKQIKEA